MPAACFLALTVTLFITLMPIYPPCTFNKASTGVAGGHTEGVAQIFSCTNSCSDPELSWDGGKTCLESSLEHSGLSSVPAHVGSIQECGLASLAGILRLSPSLGMSEIPDQANTYLGHVEIHRTEKLLLVFSFWIFVLFWGAQ